MDFTKINIIKEKIEKDIESQKNFCENFVRYFDFIKNLNKGLTKIDEEAIKRSYINELSCISLLYLFINKSIKIPKLNFQIKKIDSENYFFWYSANNDFSINNLEFLSGEQINGSFIAEFYQHYQLNADKKMLGQYYTPQAIVQKILELSKIESDNDILNKTILDPACGSGVFFVEIIHLLHKKGLQAFEIYRFIEKNTYGYDINPFAVFLTKLSILIELIILCENDDEISVVVKIFDLRANYKICNTLEIFLESKLDYIIGNPPYFKLAKGIKSLPQGYSEVIFGQTNIYSLFIFWALKNVSNTGKISFIIPQSFRSGLYFKQLRHLLSQSKICSFFFIDSKNRRLIFKNAEQAVLIMTYQKHQGEENITEIIKTKDAINCISYEIPQKKLFNLDNFFILTESNEMHNLIEKIYERSVPFKKYKPELCFGNGLFVWNQRKNYLRKDEGLPIIYSNYIDAFNFHFESSKNCFEEDDKRKPFALKAGNEVFICKGKKLLIKRTSGMENFKRIKACILDDSVLSTEEYFLENHLNLLYNRNNKQQQIELDDLLFFCAMYNSDVINFIFKCKNGNTQVSATELNCLPISANGYNHIVELMKKELLDLSELNLVISQSYGLNRKEITMIDKFKRSFI